MTATKFEKSACESCGQPLFLSKEKCRDFIEDKLKQGYIVCRCCGAKQTLKAGHDEKAGRGQKGQPSTS